MKPVFANTDKPDLDGGGTIINPRCLASVPCNIEEIERRFQAQEHKVLFSSKSEAMTSRAFVAD
ncbi:MAG: hypothetical protein WB791_04525 [Waddliaceae bacterium]